jgi:hypothetical protein
VYCGADFSANCGADCGTDCGADCSPDCGADCGADSGGEWCFIIFIFPFLFFHFYSNILDFSLWSPPIFKNNYMKFFTEPNLFETNLNFNC